MPAMPRAHGNGVELEYETVGDPAGRPLLLVQGLGAQLTSVEDGLCQALAGRGFLVVRYDNRDAGLSSWFDHAGLSPPSALYGRPESRRSSSGMGRMKLASWDAAAPGQAAISSQAIRA